MAQVLKGFFQQNPWKYKALYGMQHGDPKEKQLTGVKDLSMPTIKDLALMGVQPS